MEQTKSYGLDKVNVSFLDKSKKTLPLIITPRFDDTHDFICKWLEQNNSWVQDQMIRYGAVIVRGFKIESPPDFEKATLALDPNLCDKYRGTSPRSLSKGTKYAFSAADVPVNYPIAQHLEMSFLKAPPRFLYFGCMKESSSLGGETSLCDFRAVYQDISPELRQKFLTKQVKYTRKHHRIGEKWTYDVGAMKTWVELFGTSSKQEVEKICEEESAPPARWLGDTFYQEWVDQSCQLHPITKEPVWFNHTQVFHWSTFPAELWYAFCRMKSLKLFIHFVLVSIFTFIKYGILGYKMSLEVTFGDDTPILCSEMDEVRDAIHKNLVFSRWQKGDILCIDNFSTSHGRQPTFDKGRKVIVSWSKPLDKTQQSAIETDEVGIDIKVNFSLHSSIIKNDENIPSLQSVTPDTSPESSLSKEGAKELRSMFLGKIEEDHKDVSFHHRRLRSCPNLFEPNSDFWNKTKND